MRDLGYYDEISLLKDGDVCVEEKQSTNESIRKLLSTASKHGTGEYGYPEFIISQNNSDVVLVIECKASTKHHESAYKDQPVKYAVDGVLHYARFLKNKYNVIAIAVSGQNKKSLRTSSFVWKKDISDYYRKGWKFITSYDDYCREFHNNSDVLTLSDLRKYARDLHNSIRNHAKLKETQKPLFVGGLLLALDNKDFSNAYEKITGPKKLARDIISAIKDSLMESGMDADKVNFVSREFEFIETHTYLINGTINVNNPSYYNNVLHKILSDLHSKIYPSMKSASISNVDFMGEFYQEFIRYTGGDGKGLGIVLTPRHITELFVELADVHKNSKVLDLCAGTSGFLVAAMSKMLRGDLTVKEIEQIKNKNLYGVESQPDIFALACVNMFIRGDGKANLIKEDSLSESNNQIKEFYGKCQVGLMNPPYSQKEQKELEFVERMLDMLAIDGRGIVIIPIRNTKSDDEIRERILQKHTLESVMIMPSDLFVKVNTHTCIMTFIAGKPHHGKTWFSLWDEDGFTKFKNNRIDRYDKWAAIKKSWLKDYRSKMETPTSILKEVKYSDEWSALAYLPTDYSELSMRNFKETIRNHKLCQMRQQHLVPGRSVTDHVEAILDNKESLELFSINADQDTQKTSMSGWKFFLLSDLFDVTGSKTTPLDELLEMESTHPENRKYPYITTKASNNGVDNYFPHYTQEVGDGVLTIDSATIGYVSYQTQNFSASDHVEILTPKFKMNKYVGCFFQTILNLEQFRYGYGRKFNQIRIKETKLFLPYANGQPDYKTMETTIRRINKMEWFC